MKMESCKANKRISDFVEEACRVYLLLIQEAEKQGKSLDELVSAVSAREIEHDTYT